MARITIEDCLKKVPSRFALVHIAAQRARQLVKGAPKLVESDNRAVVTALREIAAGKVYGEGNLEEGSKK
ncbi:MAG: DNA-directed RNA polymerase subunit omega [Deltaproteobacteria bacterium]|nr:DNA-directed RNA polymerase subunit omega [Deltaproteobacteria bacterium]